MNPETNNSDCVIGRRKVERNMEYGMGARNLKKLRLHRNVKELVIPG